MPGWRSRDRPRSSRGRGREASGAAGPAAVRAPVRGPGRSQWRDRRHRQSRKPWFQNRRANGQALHARRAVLPFPLFGRTCGLVVGSDTGAVEERHAGLDAAPPLRRLQQSLPDAQPRPAAEGLRRHPPRAQFRRDLAPLRPVVVPPDDRLDRAAQVVMLRLVWRTARLDQRCKHLPLLIRQNLRPVSIRHPDQMGTILRDSYQPEKRLTHRREPTGLYPARLGWVSLKSGWYHKPYSLRNPATRE